MPRDYDKPKRSWRELDRNKDRSAHRPPDRPAMSKHKQDRSDSASKVYKGKLDAFFSGEGKAPEHVRDKIVGIEPTSPEGKKRLTALDAIKGAGTSSEADRAVDAYLEQWEIPPDYDVLSVLLTCGDEEHVETALEMLSGMLSSTNVPRRTELLEQRLRRAASLADDPDIADRAGEVLKQLRLYT